MYFSSMIIEIIYHLRSNISLGNFWLTLTEDYVLPAGYTLHLQKMCVGELCFY